jgi:hypothetical protein
VDTRADTKYSILVVPGMMNSADELSNSLHVTGMNATYYSFPGRGKSEYSKSDYKPNRYIK